MGTKFLALVFVAVLVATVALAVPRASPASAETIAVLDFDNDGEADVLLTENGDVLVDVGSFQVIATNVDLLRVFANSVGAKLMWDADGDGHSDGGAILKDFNRDGDFGEPREIRVFGDT